jgi:hypothetical protein
VPKLLTIVGSVLLATAASVAACTDGAQETERDNDASAFAREVVGVLEQVELAHDALSDLGLEDLSASKREARYGDLDAEMRRARGRIDDADAPVELQQARALFSELLVAERDIWVHMVLFARTGQELHRILANELLIDNEEKARAAVLRLQRDLAELGIDADKVGLAAYAAASEPTPVAALATPTAPPAPSPSPSPIAPPTSSPTPVANVESRPTATGVPTSTPVPPATASPASSPSAPQTATATGTPTPAPFPSASPTFEPTPPPTPSPTVVPEPPSTPTPVPSTSPTPLPTPVPVLPVLKEGELVVIRWPDLQGNPAIIAHWTIDVEARTLAMVEYPFVAGDNLEISMFLGIDELGSTLDRTYMEAPNGEVLVDLSDFSKTWNGEATTTVDGTYRVYFDNADSDDPKDMHLLITYHIPAPGTKVSR